MSQILIERELLQRLLEAYYDKWAEARAYLALQQEGQRKASNPLAIHRYATAVDDRKERELSETAALRISLRERVKTEDDAAFLSIFVP